MSEGGVTEARFEPRRGLSYGCWDRGVGDEAEKCDGEGARLQTGLTGGWNCGKAFSALILLHCTVYIVPSRLEIVKWVSPARVTG